MDGLICPACADMGLRDMPRREAMELLPCPVCQPWDQGFPGEYVLRDGQRVWIIEPSEPGQPARWVGWEQISTL